MPTHPASLLSPSKTTETRRVADEAGGWSTAHGERCLLASGQFPRGRLASSAGQGFKRGMTIMTGVPTRVYYGEEGGVVDIFHAPNICCSFKRGHTLFGDQPS